MSSTELLIPEQSLTQQRSAWFGLPLLLFMAAIVRLGAVLVVRNFHNPEIWEWGEITRNMLAGRGFSFHTATGRVVPSAYMPPAYSYVLLLLFRHFGDNTTSYVLLQVIQALAATYLVYLIYEITLVGWNRRVAICAAFLAAIYPPFIYMPAEMHSISFYIVISTAAIYFVFRYWVEIPRTRYVLYAGLLLGLLMYFRAEALALPFIFSAVLLLNGKCKWRTAILLLSVPLLCLVPWTIRNYRIFGTLVPSTTSVGINLWYGHNPQATGSQRQPWPSGKVVQPDAALTKKFVQVPADPQYEIHVSRIYSNAAIEYARSHPAREATLAMKKMFYFWTIDWNHPKARRFLYWFPTLAMILLFIVGAIRERRSLFNQHLVLTVVILFTNGLAVVLFVLPRYRLVIEPIMIPFAAAALVWIAQKWGANSAARSGASA